MITLVCGIEHTYNTADDTDTISGVIPVAGNYPTESGRNLDPQWTRLKTSSSHADSEKEGVRLEMHGGMYPFDDRKKGRKQEAVIEFICDPHRTGLEGEEDGEEERRRDVRETEDEDERSLRFIGYGPVDETDVLRLEWLTKHACEDAKDGGGGDENRSRHWGFFTWFIIVSVPLPPHPSNPYSRFPASPKTTLTPDLTPTAPSSQQQHTSSSAPG